MLKYKLADGKQNVLLDYAFTIYPEPENTRIIKSFWLVPFEDDGRMAMHIRKFTMDRWVPTLPDGAVRRYSGMLYSYS